MQIIQALIFVFASFFGQVDPAPVSGADAGALNEGYIWCQAYPDDPVCEP